MTTSPRAPSDNPPSRLDPLELRAGVLIADKYRLVRPAGFGGMGAVWVAKNEMTGAEIAIKLLLADRADSVEANARFRREAHAAAQLSHRGIVRVFDLLELQGADEGCLVIVMELLRGQTLADLIDRGTHVKTEDGAAMMLQLLSALAHAHALGIVHRDLKPDNIFLASDPDGHVTPKILDFGISQMSAPGAPRITSDGVMLGTPSYMSPEQARGSRDTDARSDVFASAIVFYELLSGKNPFAGESYHSVVAAILERVVPPLDGVPAELNAVILRALEKDPKGRYADAAAFANAVRQAMASRGPTLSSSAFSFAATPGERVPLTTTSFPPPRNNEVTADVSGTAAPSVRRRPRPRTIAWAVAVVVMAGAVLIAASRGNAPAPARTLASASGGVPMQARVLDADSAARAPAAIDTARVAAPVAPAAVIPSISVESLAVASASPLAGNARPPHGTSHNGGPSAPKERGAAPTALTAPATTVPAAAPPAASAKREPPLQRDPGF